MENDILLEAFNSLNILNEEDFNLRDIDSPEAIKDYIADDDASVLDIIDTEIKDDDEAKESSHIGDVILECSVCHSMIYKNKEDVLIDDEKGLVNIDDECPYCMSMDGYHIIGEVAPFNEVEDSEEIEDTIEDGADIETDEDDVDESLNESVLEEGGRALGLGLAGGGLGGAIGGAIGGVPGALAGAAIGGGLGTAVGQTGDDVMDAAKDVVSQNAPAIGAALLADADSEKEEMEESKVCEKCGENPCECESLEEGFEHVNVETEDQVMDMTQDENGKVIVTTEPKTADIPETEETIAPIGLDDAADIIANSEEAVYPELEDTEEQEEEVDYPMDEFDDDSFNELGESYLKNVYENVESFNTTKATINENKLIIEGIIKFNSGNNKKTSFILESADADKNGKVKFIGENAQITKGKKAFTLTGTLTEGKLTCNSLNYRYNQLNESGVSQRVYGTVKRKPMTEAMDLSKVAGTTTSVLEPYIAQLDGKTKQEIYDDVRALFNEAGIDTTGSRKILVAIARAKSDTDAQMIVTNSYLKGSNLGVN